MPTMTDFEIVLAHSPGSAAAVAEALGAAGVNIEGGCGWAHDGEGVLHVAVEGDPGPARRALEDAGATVARERAVHVTSCPDAPGEVGKLLRRLAAADVNLDLLYLTTSGRVVLGAIDGDNLGQLLS